MGKRIENKTRQEVTGLMADYIKLSFKHLKATNANLGIELHNWCSGFGKNSKWSYSEVVVGDNSYIFKDRQINDNELIRMLNDAIAMSNVRCKVFSETYGDGYWTPKETRFKRVEMYAAPCKEFVKLAKMIEKYANYSLHETDIFNVRVCGKRSAWSDSGHYDYLCYNAEKCNAIISYIRENRKGKDTMMVGVEEYFSHGDEMDYKCAMYQESEWYGCRGNNLSIKVYTPSGKSKTFNKWSMGRF
jgi:flavodoxin